MALATSLSVTVFPSVSDISYVFSYPDVGGVISLLTNVVFLNILPGCLESSICQFPPSAPLVVPSVTVKLFLAFICSPRLSSVTNPSILTLKVSVP